MLTVQFIIKEMPLPEAKIKHVACILHQMKLPNKGKSISVQTRSAEILRFEENCLLVVIPSHQRSKEIAEQLMICPVIKGQ